MNSKCNVILLVFALFVFGCNKSDNEEIAIITQNTGILLAGSIPENAYSNVLDYVNLNGVRTDSSALYYGAMALVYLDANFTDDLWISVISIGNNDNYSTSAYVEIRDNWQVCLNNNDTSYVKLLDEGDTLSRNLNWQGIEEQKYYFATYNYTTENNNITIDSVGSWNNMIDGFLGIRKIEDSDTLYGWIKIDISNHYILFADEYAIQNKNATF
ncbi:MAG: hypothetical protein GQ527_07930 [Bacteroidales bacterium]|nr:hypothetical protein [Bacteroidales bacterium]